MTKTNTLTDQCGTGSPLNPTPSVDSDGKSGMSETAFIARESAKHAAKLHRQLAQIDRTGFASAKTIETLLVNGLIRFTTPDGRNPYNHYVLTMEGNLQLLTT